MVDLGLIHNFLANAPAAGQENSMMRTLMFFGIVLVFFYLILWRPEQKRRKQMDSQRNALKAGDRVTAMGILGEVLQIDEGTVILKMYDGAKIEVLRNAITQVHKPVAEKAEAAPKEAAAEPASN